MDLQAAFKLSSKGNSGVCHVYFRVTLNDLRPFTSFTSPLYFFGAGQFSVLWCFLRVMETSGGCTRHEVLVKASDFRRGDSLVLVQAGMQALLQGLYTAAARLRFMRKMMPRYWLEDVKEKLLPEWTAPFINKTDPTVGVKHNQRSAPCSHLIVCLPGEATCSFQALCASCNAEGILGIRS